MGSYVVRGIDRRYVMPCFACGGKTLDYARFEGPFDSHEVALHVECRTSAEVIVGMLNKEEVVMRVRRIAAKASGRLDLFPWLKEDA